MCRSLFYENGSILGVDTRAECEVSRKRYLDQRAPEVRDRRRIDASCSSARYARRLAACETNEPRAALRSRAPCCSSPLGSREARHPGAIQGCAEGKTAMSRHTRLAWLALPVAMATLSACATWDPQVRALTRDPHLKGWVERCQAGDEAACQNARERVMHPFADLSKPGYAVFFENGAVYGRPTRAECEV